MFPSCSRDGSNSSSNNSNDNSGDNSWLSCSSFSNSAVNALVSLKKKEEKLKQRIEKKIQEQKEKEEEKALFYEDFGDVPQQTTPNVPQVQLTKPVKRSIPQEKRGKKKKKKKQKDRYYNLEKPDLNIIEQSAITIEEFTKRTADFNVSLRDEPQNVQLWIDYVNLQDLGEGSKRGKIEKKISILDKALTHNPDSEELLELKMLLIEKISTYDKVSSEAKLILSKHPNSRVGRKWLISSLQFNLSKMTAPGLLEIYATALQLTHRQPSEFILELVFECGLFLRQAGLWEQLWTLIYIYLEMNYTVGGSGAFTLKEKALEINELEDQVITSGLTLSELWLRIENLRSNVYFLPVTDCEVEDPQRTVLPEDFSNLLYPLAKTSKSRLASIVLLLLKVPPLPCTDSFFEFLWLKNIPWSIESPEIFLSSYLYTNGLIKFEDGPLNALMELLVGPQYFTSRIGDEQFLKCVDSMFDLILKHIDQDVQLLIIWQLRWWRLLVRVKKCSGSIYKTRAKKLLKQHRDFIPLYTEYALLEDDLGHFDVAEQVLEKTLTVHDSPVNMITADKNHLSRVYRTYAEMLLRENFMENREKALKILTALSFGVNIKSITAVNDEVLSKALERYSHVTTELIIDAADQESDVLNFEDFLTDSYPVSWIACQIWLSYLITGKSTEGTQILDKALDKLQPLIGKTLDRLKCFVEGLYEIYVNLLYFSFKKNSENFSELVDILNRAIVMFPNNTKFLLALISLKLNGFQRMKLINSLIPCGSQLTALTAFIILHSHYISNEGNDVNTLKESMYNQIKSQIDKMLEIPSLERSPLLWRLMLQCSSVLPPSDMKNIYYHALEKCPWVKSLYYEAGKTLPQDLPEIQDLLIEKELRLHITPEELEILREDTDESNKINVEEN